MANVTYYHNYQVFEFTGINQQKDGSLLSSSTAYDARNMDTADGNLSVAKGYEKIVQAQITLASGESLLKLIVPKGYSNCFIAISNKHIYKWNGTSWSSVHSFTETVTADAEIDYIQTKIYDDECIIISSKSFATLKFVLGDSASVVQFGTAAGHIDMSAISAYDAENGVITLASAMSFDAWRRCYCDGIYYVHDGVEYYWGDVISAYDYDSAHKKLQFQADPLAEVQPSVGDMVKYIGGDSRHNVAYVDTMYNRLFSAGDPDNPNRLYWSAVPGDGRTVEDWVTVDGSQDASGGHVQIGEADGDEIISISAMENYILINKRYSAWRLYGNRPSTFTVERVDRNGEMMNHASVINMYGNPFWLSKSGLMYYNGSAISNIEGGISSIQRFLETVTDVSHSRGCIANHRMYFSCRTIGTCENAIVTYDVTTNSFMIRDGFTLADITAEDGIVYLMTTDGYVCQFEKGTTYNGSPITAYWQTQPTDLNAKFIKKHPRKITMRVTGDRMELFVYGDHHQREIERLLNPEDENGYFVEMLNFDLTVRMQLEFRNVNGSAFCIEGGFDLMYEPERRPAL